MLFNKTKKIFFSRVDDVIDNSHSIDNQMIRQKKNGVSCENDDLGAFDSTIQDMQWKI